MIFNNIPHLPHGCERCDAFRLVPLDRSHTDLNRMVRDDFKYYRFRNEVSKIILQFTSLRTAMVVSIFQIV